MSADTTPLPPRPVSRLFRPLAFAAISATVFLVSLALNLATPLAADDFDGTVIFDSTQRIAGPADILRSASVYYLSWSGRIVSRVLLQTFVWLGKPTFDVLNAMAFLGVVLLVYFNANGRNPIRLSLLAGIPLLIWFSLPLFGQSVLWLSGSVNYLWPMLWVLGVLLPYRLHAEKPRPPRHRLLAAVGIVPLAVLAGCSNENVAPALIALIAAYVFIFRREGQPVPAWSVTGLGGVVVGAAIMLAAPGNSVRAQGLGSTPGATGAILLRRFLVVTHTIFVYDLFVIFSVGTILWLALRDDPRTQARLALRLYALFMGAAFVATWAMVGSPEFPERVWTGITLFAVTGVAIAYQALDFSERRTRDIAVAILLSATLLFAVDCADVYFTDLRATQRAWSERIAFIHAEKAAGHLDVAVPPIAARTRFNALYDLTDLDSRPDGWPNPDVARYFGLRSIVSSAGAEIPASR